MAGLMWPLRLTHGDVVLRPMRYRDKAAWTEVRTFNQEWLQPWEASNPDGTAKVVKFGQHIRAGRREAKAGRSLPMAIEFHGQFIGQITLGNVMWGSLRQGYIGYWIDSRFAGRGITPTAVSMITDYALREAGLHRIEINIRPENTASIRVVEKLGFTFEGRRPQYLHIQGDWRDHNTYVMTSSTLPVDGLLPLRPRHH